MPRLTTLKPRVALLRTPERVAPMQVERPSSRPWARMRAETLSADPLCRLCRLEGRIAEATEVDHIVPLWAGGSNDAANRQGLCHDHHAEKTSAEAAQRAKG